MRPSESPSKLPRQIQNPADVGEPPPEVSKKSSAPVQQTTFKAIHTAANSTPYPNGKHADKEKDQNNARQVFQNSGSDVNDEAKQKQRERLQSKKSPGTYSAKQFSEDLKKIKDGHTELNHSSSNPSRPSSSHPSNDEHDIGSNPKEALQSPPNLQQLINDIRECNASIQKATESNQEKEIGRLQRKLESLQQQYAHLRQTLPSDRDTDSDSSVGPPSETSESYDSWSLFETNSPSTKEEQLRSFHEELSKWEEDLKKNKTELITKTHAKANKEEIAQCQQEVDALQKDIEKLKQILQIAVTDSESTPEASDVGAVSPTQSPPQSPKGSVADVILRTRAGRRHYATTNESAEATNTSNATSTPLKQLHESSTRNSALFSREDLKPLFTNEAKKALSNIDEKLEVIAKSIDKLLAERRAIQKKIKKSDAVENPKNAINEVRLIDEKVKELVLKLGRLLNRQNLVEELVLPSDQQLTSKQKNAKYEETLNKYKSANTLRLERDYKQKRTDYERKVLGSRTKQAVSLLAGSVTNFWTFFWGNSLTRVLAGALPTAAGYIGGALAGLLHVVVGGPVLKQASSASWNAPVLIEFNNYWKVAGSLWGDRLRAGLGSLGVDRWVGENHKKKYQSPDPAQTDFVDIEQLWQKTRGLWPLFKARYKTEEAAYFSYAFNFTGKAAVVAGFAGWMATKSDASRVFEWAVHSFMGWFSGAQTVAGIQVARSQVPGAVESAIPSQEIHTAHAAMLQSLLKDLEDAYRNLRAQTPVALGDAAERDLLKAIRRTQKALDEAKTKSGYLGTFQFEFLAQFKTLDARADVAAEVIGRALSVMPSAMLSNLLASWRTSGDPLSTFAGHALPALILIAPPGWTARPLYVGFFRALFQMVINQSSPRANTTSSTTTTTEVPHDVHDSIVEGSESSSYLGDEFSESGQSNTGAKEDESVIVTVSDREEASDDESDDEKWKGQPTGRNKDNYW